MKTILSFVLIFCFSLTSVWASETGHKKPAHDKAPHHGSFVAVGEYHLELLVKNKELLIYVTDHSWNPKKVDGATGKVWVLSNKKKTEISLKPETDNLISAKGDFVQSDDMKVMVKLNMPNQKTLNARFTPLAKKGGH